MSNHLAVAGVTATLVQLLDEAVTRDVPVGRVVPGRPDAGSVQDADPKVLVFLYRVEPNPAWRNEDLPTRSSDGRATVQRPQAALTLHYLLTFVGDEAAYEPQRMLGSVAGALHFHPVLSRDEIGRAVQAAVNQDPNSFLATLDLAAQPELVRLTPSHLGLDDLSGLWSSFFQAEYRLSAAYRADVVLLTPPVAASTPLPVRERRLLVTTLGRPQLRRVVPADGPQSPVLAGSTVYLDGSDLRGDEVTTVRFGEQETAPISTTSVRLEAVVPATVRAGAVAVVVEHRRSTGGLPALRPAGASDVVPVVVHPRVRRTGGAYVLGLADVVEAPPGTFSGTVTATVDPPVEDGQEVSLLLDAVGGGRALTFLRERRDAPGGAGTTSEIAVAFTAVPAGDYLVRIVVSGAQSPLDAGVDGAFTGPRVRVG